MKRILSFVSLLALSVLSLFTLAACGSSEPDAEELLKSYIFQLDGQEVSEDFAVVSQLTRGKGEELKTYPMTWESNSEFVKIAKEADAENNTYAVTVTRPTEEVTATLKATLKVSDKNTASKNFTVRVEPYNVYDFSAAYKFAQNGNLVTGDFPVHTEYQLKGTDLKATIAWSVPEEFKDILVLAEDGKSVKVIPAEEKTAVKIKATFTYNGESTTMTYRFDVQKPTADRYGVTDKVAADTAYKLGIIQGNKNATYYYNGKIAAKYFGGTVQDVTQGVDVFAEAVEGGFNLYFNEGDKKVYLYGVKSGSHYNFKAGETKGLWTWNDTYKTVSTMVEGKEAVMGTNHDHDTIGLELVEKMADAKNEIFPAQLFVKLERVIADTPVAKVPYTLTMNVKDNKQVFFTGKMNKYWGASSDKIEAAVQVYPMAVEGGFNLMFFDGQDTKYINSVVSSGHYNFVIDDAATTAWAWNADNKTFTTVLDEKTFFIGTSGNHDTFSLEELKDVATAYPAHLYGYADEKPVENPQPKPELVAPVEKTVAEAKECDAKTLINLTVKIVALGNEKIIAQDATGFVLVKNDETVKGLYEGGSYVLTGKMEDVWNKQPQFVIQKSEKAAEAVKVSSTAIAYDGAKFDAYVAAKDTPTIELITFTATVSVGGEGKYLNGKVDGVQNTRIQASLEGSTEMRALIKELKGKSVTFTGYTVCVSGSKNNDYVKILITSLESAAAEFINPDDSGADNKAEIKNAFTKGDVTFKFDTTAEQDKDGHKVNLTKNYSYEFRFYGLNSLTITSTKDVAKIMIVLNSTSNADRLTVNEGATITVDGSIATITGDNLNNVVINNGDNGQVKIAQIVVFYK